MKKQQFHRHGEVILKPSKLPAGAKLIEEGHNVIVGHSESSHHHVLTLEKENIKVFEFEGKTYLDIPLEAKLVHQKELDKHETQIIQPGIYERGIRESYSYLEKVMRRVQD